MTKIILDCDPGHDDAIALLLALGSPQEIEVVGVTTVNGNVGLDHTTANAIRVLDHVGRADIPVAAGADRPLIRERYAARNVHGETGLDGPDLPPPQREPGPEHAVEWMASALSKEPITLVPTGPLTNIAVLLERHPENIERIVLMGGAYGEGNVTPEAEFNIWCDPEAADKVFNSGLDVTMVGLDVTHKALMTPAHVERLSGKAGRLVADLYGFYAKFHKERYGWDGVPVHDAVAVAHVIDPTLLETTPARVTIDTGSERGRTRADFDSDEPNCHVATGIDSDRFLDLLVTRISELGPG